MREQKILALVCYLAWNLGLDARPCGSVLKQGLKSFQRIYYGTTGECFSKEREKSQNKGLFFISISLN